MGKKAEPEITVLELVGERRFGCRFGNGMNLDGDDLKNFDLMLNTVDLFLTLKNLCREWVGLIRVFREKHRDHIFTGPGMLRKLIEEADQILKETVLSPDPFSPYNQFLETLKKKKMGVLSDELVIDMKLVAKEVSLLKKAAGF